MHTFIQSPLKHDRPPCRQTNEHRAVVNSEHGANAFSTGESYRCAESTLTVLSLLRRSGKVKKQKKRKEKKREVSTSIHNPSCGIVVPPDLSSSASHEVNWCFLGGPFVCIPSVRGGDTFHTQSRCHYQSPSCCLRLVFILCGTLATKTRSRRIPTFRLVLL